MNNLERGYDTRPLLTVAQAGLRLGISRSAAYLLVKETRIASVAWGSFTRVHPAEIDRFIAAATIPAKHVPALRATAGSGVQDMRLAAKLVTKNFPSRTTI